MVHNLATCPIFESRSRFTYIARLTKLRHPSRICRGPFAVVLIDHSRAGMTHLANALFFRNTGGK